jgi:hypothetical protein
LPLEHLAWEQSLGLQPLQRVAYVAVDADFEVQVWPGREAGHADGADGVAGRDLLADLAVHATVEGWAWLAVHDGLVLAGALALAGGVQFTALKQRCLTLCRDPRAMLFRHYRRGAPAAWALGARHGLSCLGCCWAMMLVMFATGVGSLWWMAGLAAVTVAEKTTRWGPKIVGPVGIVLLLAAAVLAVDEWGTVPAIGVEIPAHDHGDPTAH